MTIKPTKHAAYASLAMSSSARLDVSRPPLKLTGTEPWRAAMEFLAFKLNEFTPRKTVPSGDGHPVIRSSGHPGIIFPGLATDGSAAKCLCDYCESLGYTVIDWGRGVNFGPTGDLDRWLADLARHTADLLKGRKGTASLIGWSLGGLYAREIGKLLAPQVRQVITIGTPFNAEADATRIGWLSRLLGGSSAAFGPAVIPLASRRLRQAACAYDHVHLQPL